MDSDWNWKPTTSKKAIRRGRRSGAGYEDLPWAPLRMKRRYKGSSDAKRGKAKTKSLEEVVGKIIREDFCNCGFCDGTGEKPSGSVCPVCKGKGAGRISIKPPAVKCGFCRGRGAAQPRSLITCRVCGGTGVVSVVEPIKLCPECAGKGRTSSGSETPPCKRCKGKGVVTHERENRRFLPTPSGTEGEVAQVIYQLDGEATVSEISPTVRISRAYTEYVCKSMVEKGYLEKVDRNVYVLTPACEEAMEEKEIGHLQKVSPEEKEILRIIRSGWEITPKEIAKKMGTGHVGNITKICRSMGENDLVDVLLSGEVIITHKGERALEI